MFSRGGSSNPPPQNPPGYRYDMQSLHGSDLKTLQFEGTWISLNLIYKTNKQVKLISKYNEFLIQNPSDQNLHMQHSANLSQLREVRIFMCVPNWKTKRHLSQVYPSDVGNLWLNYVILCMLIIYLKQSKGYRLCIMNELQYLYITVWKQLMMTDVYHGIFSCQFSLWLTTRKWCCCCCYF